LSWQYIHLYDSSTNHEIANTTTDTGTGNYKFTWQENSPGTYTYYVRFAGNSQDRPRTSENVAVNVLSSNALNAALAIFAPQTVLQGDDFTLSGYLQQTYSGHPARNQIIHLYDSSTNQEFGSAQTDEQGYYSFTWQENSPGTYDYYALFEGNSQVTPFRSENVTVKVSDQKDSAYLDIFGPLYLVNQGDTFTLSGTLVKACVLGPLKNSTVYLYRNSLSVNNQEIGSVQTDELGYYSLKWQENSPGTYDYYAHFEGNSQVTPFRSENVTVFVSS
jgi:hypothetical protein